MNSDEKMNETKSLRKTLHFFRCYTKKIAKCEEIPNEKIKEPPFQIQYTYYFRCSNKLLSILSK
jgi:hypothetical protein